MPILCEKSSVAALIRKCTAVATLKAARIVHALLLTTVTATSISPYTYNNIISMYVRCGALGDAVLVFDEMPKRSLVSFNAVIAAHSRAADDAPFSLQLLAQMGKEGFRPNGSTLTSLIQASSSLQARFLGSLLHSQVVKFGFLNDVCVQTSLVGMYSNSLDLESAEKVFGWMVDQDVVAWNSIIFGFLKHEKAGEALFLFNHMLNIGLAPDQSTYSMVLNACSKLEDHYLGKIMHAKVIVSNTYLDLVLQNSLIDMYCNSGDIHTAIRIFTRMETRDLVSWNTIIAGYTENGDKTKSIYLFIQLKKTSLLKPDEYTFATIILATSELLIYGNYLHAQVIKSGFETNVFVGSVLVSLYFKNDKTESAGKIFNSISEKDDVLWTEMITGYSRTENGENAFKFFYEMYREGYQIDSFALSGALSACADLAASKQGETIHTLAVKSGYDVEMTVCGSLVDMYAKIGDLNSAQSIFLRVKDPDLKCSNAMLGGYSHHGRIEQALKLFREIQSRGLKPDKVTFLSLLSACNHSGMVKMGEFLWRLMKEEDIKPEFKHYSCMVSLLSRAGLLDEAEEIIHKSPYFNDNVELWRTLLSSCVMSKNLEVGERAAEQVFRSDAKDGPTHVLLANLYGRVGKWEKVAEMRKKMKEKMVEKVPGLSWIEFPNNLAAFCAGNGLQPQPIDEEAWVVLQGLEGNMVVETEDYFEA